MRHTGARTTCSHLIDATHAVSADDLARAVDEAVVVLVVDLQLRLDEVDGTLDKRHGEARQRARHEQIAVRQRLTRRLRAVGSVQDCNARLRENSPSRPASSPVRWQRTMCCSSLPGQRAATARRGTNRRRLRCARSWSHSLSSRVLSVVVHASSTHQSCHCTVDSAAQAVFVT